MNEKIFFEGKEYTIIGKYAVTRDADCICLFQDKWVPAKKYVNKQKNKRSYYVVVRNLDYEERNGRGRSRKTTERKYLSRLVAEVFVPNPNNYKMVTYKNADSLDCRADNLEWSTDSEIKVRYYQMDTLVRFKKKRKCQGCGKLLADWNEKNFCCSCRKRLSSLLREESAREAIKKALQDKDKLLNENKHERADHMIRLREAGVKLEDIGNLYGLTKQRVQQILNRGDNLDRK